jgi:hypothetical protein
MHIVVARSSPSAVRPYPAPVCEPCNEPMGLNGEYTPTMHGKMSLLREYRCRMCGAHRMIRRTPRED